MGTIIKLNIEIIYLSSDFLYIKEMMKFPCKDLSPVVSDLPPRSKLEVQD